MSRSLARYFAVVAALALSSQQWRYFPCNKARTLSFLGGVASVLVLYGIGEIIYRIARSEVPRAVKHRDIAATILVGSLVVIAVGFFTLLTHLCP